MEKTININVLGHRVWEYRRSIVIFVFVATVLSGTAAIMMPPVYRANASLVPPGEDESGGIAKLMRGVTVPGIKIPASVSPADMFMAVLQSRRLREDVVNRFNLKKVYNRKFMQDAVNDLGSNTKFKVTDAGTIVMWLEDRDPRRAAAMLQAFIEGLDRFNRESRSTKGRRTRIFIEKRLDENKVELAKAEDALSVYQATHKAAIITPAMSTAAEATARIYAQRMALQVRLGVVHGYSRENSQEEEQITAQLAQLDRQLRALPETGLELARLLREVKKFEQIYELLTAQYEEARIDEARDIATVDVLDPPVVPEKKNRPKRLLITFVGFLLGLGTGIAYAMFQGEKQPALVPASLAR
jgi:tyrosine-protein kinase Etk/Wzc